MSNTKLDAFQKMLCKAMKRTFQAEGGQLFSYPDKGVTVAVTPAFPGSRMCLVSVSYASPNEQKFRRKVGEFHALNHMQNGEFVQVPAAYGMPAVAAFFADMSDL